VLLGAVAPRVVGELVVVPHGDEGVPRVNGLNVLVAAALGIRLARRQMPSM
jgi:hypothetical protein